MTVIINKITSQLNSLDYFVLRRLFICFISVKLCFLLILKIIQLMSESFESPSDQIGLFTFYKEQQDDDLRKKAENNRKKRHKKNRNKPKSRYQDYQKSLPTSVDRKELSKDKASDDFLRNVKGKNGKKLALTEISEKGVTNSEEEDNGDDRPFKKYSKEAKIPLTPKATPSVSRKEKQAPPTNKPSQPSPQITQTQYFNQRHSLNSPVISTKINHKEKIIAQINSHLTKDKTHFIDSAEKDLILSRKDQFKQTQKHPLASLLPFNERLLTIQKNQQVKVASQRETTLKNSKTTKELHELNKRYFNNLMESLYIRPECNQTVYRILKGTLKLPEVMRSRTHHKTEHRSPERSNTQLRSHSFYKTGCKIAVLGKLIPERLK